MPARRRSGNRPVLAEGTEAAAAAEEAEEAEALEAVVVAKANSASRFGNSAGTGQETGGRRRSETVQRPIGDVAHPVVGERPALNAQCY